MSSTAAVSPARRKAPETIEEYHSLVKKQQETILKLKEYAKRLKAKALQGSNDSTDAVDPGDSGESKETVARLKKVLKELTARYKLLKQQVDNEKNTDGGSSDTDGVPLESSDVKRLKAELEEKTLLLESLRNNLAQMQEAPAQSETPGADHEDELKQLRQRNMELKASKHTLAGKAKQILAKLNQFKGALKECEEERKRLSAEVDSLKSTNSTLSTRNEELEVMKREKDSSFSIGMKEVVNLKKRLSHLEQQNVEAVKAKETATEALTELQNQLKSSKEDLCTVKEALQAAELEKASILDELKSSKEKTTSHGGSPTKIGDGSTVKELQEECEKYKKMAQDYKDSRVKLGSKTKQLLEKLNETKQALATEETSKAELSNEIVSAKEKYENELSQEKLRHREEIIAVEANLVQKCQSVTDEVARLQLELRETAKNAKEATDALNLLKQDSDKLKSQLAASEKLQQECEKYEIEIKELNLFKESSNENTKQLQQKLNEMKQELEEAERKHEEDTSSLQSSFLEKSNSTREESSKQSEELKAMRTEMDMVVKERDQVLSKLKVTGKELEDRKISEVGLLESNKELNAKIDSISVEVKSKEVELKNMIQQCKRLEENVGVLMAECDGARQQERSTNKSLAEVQQELQSSLQTVKDLNAEIKTLQTNNSLEIEKRVADIASCKSDHEKEMSEGRKAQEQMQTEYLEKEKEMVKSHEILLKQKMEEFESNASVNGEELKLSEDNLKKAMEEIATLKENLANQQ